jgi:uncharacterized membrane-anchored protein YitT (DUF2179 family)
MTQNSCGRKRVALGFAAGCLSVASSGCDIMGDGMTIPFGFSSPGLRIVQDSVSVVVGDTVRLTARYRPADSSAETDVTDVTWSTASSSIATVTTSGLVSGIGVGRVYVAAISLGGRDSALVVVLPD